MDEIYWYSDGGLLAQVKVLYHHHYSEGMVRVETAFGEHYIKRSLLIPIKTDVLSTGFAPYAPTTTGDSTR